VDRRLRELAETMRDFAKEEKDAEERVSRGAEEQ